MKIITVVLLGALIGQSLVLSNDSRSDDGFDECNSVNNQYNLETENLINNASVSNKKGYFLIKEISFYRYRAILLHENNSDFEYAIFDTWLDSPQKGVFPENFNLDFDTLAGYKFSIKNVNHPVCLYLSNGDKVEVKAFKPLMIKTWKQTGMFSVKSLLEYLDNLVQLKDGELREVEYNG